MTVEGVMIRGYVKNATPIVLISDRILSTVALCLEGASNYFYPIINSILSA